MKKLDSIEKLMLKKIKNRTCGTGPESYSRWTKLQDQLFSENNRKEPEKIKHENNDR